MLIATHAAVADDTVATIVNFGATLGGTRARGDCPENFVNIVTSGDTLRLREYSTCVSGYELFWLTADCALGQSEFGLCTIPTCSVGRLYDHDTGECLDASATVVNFGATLGKTYKRDRCPENFVNITMSDASLRTQEYSTCVSGYVDFWLTTDCTSGQSEFGLCTIPCDAGWLYDDELGMCISHNATVVNFGATLGGTRTRGACPENFVTVTTSKDTLRLKEYSTCVSGYADFWLAADCALGQSEFDMCTIPSCGAGCSYDSGTGSCLCLDATVVNFGATLGAVTRTRGDCPENFADITASTNMLKLRVGADCASGYESMWLDTCTSGVKPSAVCTMPCDAGATYNGAADACITACSVNPGRNVTLRAANGIVLPLYSSRMTMPSLNVLTSNGNVCYGNLAPGAQSGAINVTVSGQTYHMTD